MHGGQYVIRTPATLGGFEHSRDRFPCALVAVFIMRNAGSVIIVPGYGMVVMVFADAKKMVEEIVKAMQGDHSARSAGGDTGAAR